MNTPLPPVLVVDDEKNMRLSLQTMLKDEGYTTRLAESAEGALEMLAGGELSGGEWRRIGEIICFQRLEAMRAERLTKLVAIQSKGAA